MARRGPAESLAGTTCAYGVAHRNRSNVKDGFFTMSTNQPVLFAVVVVSLAGCADNLAPHNAPSTPTTENERATVIGRVTNTAGAPVAGATVLVRSSGEHATSDSTGAFTLE